MFGAKKYKGKKIAYVDQTPQFTYIESGSGVSATMGDPMSFSLYMGPQPTDEEVGQAVREALRCSRKEFTKEEILTFFRETSPQSKQAWYDETVRRYGYKSQNELISLTKTVVVDLQDDEIIIEPWFTKNGDWDMTRSENITLSASVSDSELGQHVKDRLSIVNSDKPW